MSISNSNNNSLNEIICTSCAKSIDLAADNGEYYKCQQCAHHYVCIKCSKLPVNIEGNHKLAKIFITNIYNQQQGEKPFSNNQSSSIFTTEDYLKSYLTYCDHCLDIIWDNKQVSYRCKQCPNFGVCEKCVKLMSTHHPTQHSFNKSSPCDETGSHFGVTCDGCEEENIAGLRYQCIQCNPSYDLCSKCVQKAKTIHNESHEFQSFQDPLVSCSNQKLLAQRALILFHRQEVTSNDQRDPLTGWTKNDAEQIVQREEEVLRRYEQRLQEENQRRIEESQQELDNAKMVNDMFLEFSEDMKRRSGGRYCPNCGEYYY